MKVKYIGKQDDIFNFISDSNIELKTGCDYNLESLEEGTLAQNNLFHKLLNLYWRSGVQPYLKAKNEKDFKDQIKLRLGSGFEFVIYAEIIDKKVHIEKVKSFDKIPDRVKADPDFLKMARGHLKSWVLYAKKEREATLKNLIADMIHNNIYDTISGKEFSEILETIGSEI